jgi:hypothetical protein
MKVLMNVADLILDHAKTGKVAQVKCRSSTARHSNSTYQTLMALVLLCILPLLADYYGKN